MKRSISVAVGKGSVNHNSRVFHAQNTDPERSDQNICYINESIKKVYHELFDEALKAYNAKQTRADRRIENYYEKICDGKQEKPFHEIILQIGNRDDMNAQSPEGQLAVKVLDEYMQGFQDRNPSLRVFSAHLHMDEATPHLHIDFVPITTGSKRGLETRVSLKKALEAQGFRGGTRMDTEWNQWVASEKEQLAAVMERHGIQWEQKGTHEKHLSVLDYEKEMRSREVAELTEQVAALKEQVAEKKGDYEAISSRIQNFDKGEKSLDELKKELDSSPDYALPEPQGLMSAKSYKTRFADPLIKRLKQLVVTVLAKYFEVRDDYLRLNNSNGRYYRENERLESENGYLTAKNAELKEENRRLRAENKDFALLRKVFGKERVDDLVSEARAMQQKRRRNRGYERG